ncbi:MAG: asparagine synthase (glutamine-hydrolyzing) [Gammaproteobacteria bacterium]
MCGIAGLLTSRQDVDADALLRSMAATLQHRGPDGEGYFLATADAGGTRVGLAHKRLAIIDLDGGRQPIASADGRIQLVFNGEIYNYRELRAELEARGHRFATNSDSESIVHAYAAWGEDCVAHLAGMFAFALWDAEHARLLLARDRFGKKPLFVHQHGTELLFASEIKALLVPGGVRAEVDTDVLGDYLRYRYVPAPRTLFLGIRKLEPGCCLSVAGGVMREWRYWEPPDRLPLAAPAAEQDAVGHFAGLLDDAVRTRLVSDVPFGAFLSGGIDSSAVVVLMARHCSAPLRTFSVGFAERTYSELDHARVIAGVVRSEHHELVVSETDLMTTLPDLIGYRDAPVCEPSDIPIFLLAREAARTVKMVLTGEGSDEILGGYPKHVWEPCAALYQGLSAPVRRRLFEPLVEALPYRFHRARLAAHCLGIENWAARMPAWFGAINDARSASLVAAVGGPATVVRDGPPFDTPPTNSALRRILYFDQSSWLPDNLLERGDRMTMAHSLEARMPFLDHRLASYVSSLPDHYRVRGRRTKWLLREALRAHLPAHILGRRKVGFRVPVAAWFRGPMRDFLLDHLRGTDSRTRCYYDPATLDAVIDAHLSGRRNYEKLLWTLLNLELWQRRYAAGA